MPALWPSRSRQAIHFGGARFIYAPDLGLRKSIGAGCRRIRRAARARAKARRCARSFLRHRRHQFAKRRAKRRFGEGIDVDAVEQGFRESLADIGERGPARVGGREFAKGLSERGDHGAASLWPIVGLRDARLKERLIPSDALRDNRNYFRNDRRSLRERRRRASAGSTSAIARSSNCRIDRPISAPALISSGVGG